MLSVREALVALETLGYVDLVHGVGTRVRGHGGYVPARDDDMIALLEARRLLEGTAAAQAARQATPGGTHELALTMQNLQATALSDAADRIRDFHLCLAGLTGNGAITLSIEQLWPPNPSDAPAQSLWAKALHHNLAGWVINHQRIFKAIMTKSPHSAETAMNDFSDQAMADFFKALETRDVTKAAQAIAGKQRQFAQRRLGL